MEHKKHLKRCPWCGNYPEIKRYGDGWLVSCESIDCFIQPYANYRSKHNALFAWNKRVNK